MRADGRLPRATETESLAAVLDALGLAPRRDAEEGVGAGEIDAGLLLVGLDLKQHGVLRQAVADHGAAQGVKVTFLVEPAEVGGELRRDFRKMFPVGAGQQGLPASDSRETLQLYQLRQDF